MTNAQRAIEAAKTVRWLAMNYPEGLDLIEVELAIARPKLTTAERLAIIREARGDAEEWEA